MILCKERSFYKTAIRLTGFIALQNVVVCLVGLADNIMIGAWSQDALSGVALANQIQFLLQMVMSGFGEGMGVLASQYWGQQRLSPIRKVLCISLEAAAVLALVFLGLAQIIPRQILSLLTTDNAVINEGISYMRIVSFSYLFFGFSMMLSSVQRSIENVHIGTISSVSGVLVNVALNWILIFGKFGMPAMGVKGAAIATLAARIVEFGVLAVYTLRSESKLKILFSDFISGNKNYLKDFMNVALPVALSGANWGIAQTVQTAILGHMGTAAIAANSIANSIFQVLSVVAFGMSSASAVIIGKTVGNDERDKLKSYVNSLQLIYLIIGVITSILLMAVREPVLSFYAVSQQTVDLSRRFINILCVTVIGTAYQCSCLAGIVRGGGDTKFTFYNDMIHQWLIVIPLSALAAFIWNMSPVWVLFFLKSDQLLKCIVAFFEVNSYRWVRKVTHD